MGQLITGTVVRGTRRGHALGFPTANLSLRSRGGRIPPFGIYAGRALGRPAAISIGVRPTFGDSREPLVEVHVLDFDEDLYGFELEVELLEYLRPEARFDSAEALVEQMERDVAEVRARVPGG